jgi:hypothetical protein
VIDQADCIVAFGAALTQRTTSMGAALPALAPLIHVDDVRGNTLDELRALAPFLAAPDGPIRLDCMINASVAAPFMYEAHGAKRH